MKIMVVGSLVTGPDAGAAADQARFKDVARRLGSDIARAGHTLVVCSPFEGSADIEVLRGVSSSQDGAAAAKFEFHYPYGAEILAEIERTCDELSVPGARVVPYPAVAANGVMDRTNSWLLAQIKAMEECTALIAIGGNVAGASNLFLLLAESGGKALLPIPTFGGAAAVSFERLFYPLQRMLGDRFAELQNPGPTVSVVALVEALAEVTLGQAKVTRASGKPNRYFISYSRANPEAADFVEMTLRRRKCLVFRDEYSFPAGGDLPRTIRENINIATVFVVLWCREYACSPHCHDEFALALDRHANGSLRVVILRLDDTRMVPPRARTLLYYDCGTRPALEARLNEQIDRLEHGTHEE